MDGRLPEDGPERRSGEWRPAAAARNRGLGRSGTPPNLIVKQWLFCLSRTQPPTQARPVHSQSTSISSRKKRLRVYKGASRPRFRKNLWEMAYREPSRGTSTEQLLPARPPLDRLCHAKPAVWASLARVHARLRKEPRGEFAPAPAPVRAGARGLVTREGWQGETPALSTMSR